MNHTSNVVSSRAERFVWCLYDFANSSFPTVIITAAYVIYFKETVVGQAEPGRGDALWGVANSLGALVVFFLAPLLGAVSDFLGLKRRFLQFFTMVCVLSTAGLVLTSSGTIVLAMLLVIVSIVGFEGSAVFYNAFLPELVDESNMGKLSGNGWALGYLGGLGCLIVLIVAKLDLQQVPLLVAAWYFVFSMPTLIVLRDRQTRSDRPASGYEAVTRGVRRLWDTVREIRKYRRLVRFLISYFFYNNAVLTIIVFAVAFARDSLKFTVKENITLIVVMNVIAAPGAYVFGRWVDRIGAKNTLIITLVMWLVVVFGAELAAWPGLFSQEEAKDVFWLVAGMASLCIGAVQSTSRAFVGQMAPEGRAAEFYGFMAFAGKGSAVLGPIVFGFASDFFDSQRVAVLTIGIFFVLGLLLLLRVPAKVPDQQGGV